MEPELRQFIRKGRSAKLPGGLGLSGRPPARETSWNRLGSHGTPAILTRLIALVEQLLHLLEGLAERRLASSSWTLSSWAERLRFSRRCIAALA